MDVGLIGLGAMGTLMAHNLLDADLLTAVYNRTRSKAEPFVDRGVTAAASPAALAEQTEVTFVMVTADDALHAVLDGPDGVVAGLEPDDVVVNTSTVSVEATDETASAVRAANGRFVDAPVSGTIGPAEADTLTVLAGAPLFEYKGPVVEARDFEKQFPVDLLLKDLDLIAEAAERQGAYLPQTAATREAVNGAKALGHGDEDMMAIVKLLETVAGTTVGGEDAAN